MLTYDGDAAYDGSLQNYMYPSDTNLVIFSGIDLPLIDYVSCCASNRKCFYSSISTAKRQGIHQSFNMRIGTSLASESSLTIAQEQKFTIREISPEWVYVTEPSKVLIVGTFTCDPLNNEWICMFGDTEVPVEIIQEGVISCHAPPPTPGKVTICITSGNREACSEVREFEYRDKPHMHMHNTSTENEISRRSEELRLLVRFVQTLLSDKIGQKGKSNGPDYVESSIASEDSWNQIIEALTDDSPASSRTTDWL
ncbi:ankyrin repeat-containing protein, partial [Tanacetum coccineum]